MIDFPASPTTGQLFTASGTTWRYDGEKWTLAFTTASSIVYTSDTPPANPSAGTLWWDSVSGQLFVWYVDPNSAEWVAASSSGGLSDAPTDGQMYGRQSSAWTPLQSPTGNVGRNLIHNPLFNIAQRGTAGFSGNGYTLDRWQSFFSTAGQTVAIQQYAITPAQAAVLGDESAKNSLLTNFTGSAATGAYMMVSQGIEDVLRLSGKTVTVSFWAAGGSAGLGLGVCLTQNFGTGGSPSASVSLTGQKVALTTVWQRFSLTFSLPSASGKTFGTNGNSQTSLELWCSSDIATYGTRNANLGAQSGALQMWGIQLEVGAQATALEKPDPQQDLSKCQRFYWPGQLVLQGYGTAGTGVGTTAYWPVTMRASPTVTAGTNANANLGTVSFSPLGCGVYVSAAPSATGNFTLNQSFVVSADL